MSRDRFTPPTDQQFSAPIASRLHFVPWSRKPTQWLPAVFPIAAVALALQPDHAAAKVVGRKQLAQVGHDEVATAVAVKVDQLEMARVGYALQDGQPALRREGDPVSTRPLNISVATTSTRPSPSRSKKRTWAHGGLGIRAGERHRVTGEPG